MTLARFCAPRRRVAPLLAVLAAALAGTAHASASPQSTLALKACRLPGHPTELQCGTLQRPLDPTKPAGQQINLRVVVLPALARNKLPDPVVVLAGGPGQSAVDLLPTMASRFTRLSQRRDLVFVDQRGTGKSANLDCPDERALSMAEGLDADAQMKRLDACRADLMKLPHGDLTQYTTTIAMQDLDAVRQALGVAQWNVQGGSYGTRAGLEYLRQFPQATRRLILDGLAPPDMVLPKSFSTDNQAALDALLAHCAQDPSCQKAYPDLAGQWKRLMASLPREVNLINPVTGKFENVRLMPDHVLRAVRGPMYVPSLSAVLPAAIAQASEGNFTALAGLSAAMGSNRASRLAWGMHFSVICAEDLPRMALSKDAPGPDYGAIDAQMYERVCRNWPRGTVPEAFYSMPKAQTAVLLLSGGADPVTPPRHGERTAAALGPMAKHVVVPAAGHGVSGLPCMRDVMARFIEAKTDAEALAVKAECAATMPRATAFVPPNPLLPPVQKEGQK